MPREAARSAHERRLEVERVLDRRRLLRGPRRLRSRGPSVPNAEGVRAEELRAALEELGPVFSAFGRYLASRADLLGSRDCLRLEELAEGAQATPITALEEQLQRQLGRPPGEVFPSFEELPFDVRWWRQSHRARLASGEPVVVRVIHPGLEGWLESELEALEVFKNALPVVGCGGTAHLDEVLTDFRHTVEARLDLGAEADRLERIGRDAERSDLLVVPRVYREVSARRVLTVQWLPGSTLEELATAPAMQELDARDLARRVGLIWLHMALVGHGFPIEADLQELPDGRLAVTGGLFAELPDAARVHLWSYLRATVEHFPDRATAHLLHEVTKLDPGASEGELRTRIRQVVPFRDGAWSETGESLGEYAVLHWRVLREVGFRPHRHLDSFYRGLFWAARTARRFAPERDPLREAVLDFDWLAGWNQMRQLTAPRQMGTTAEAYLETLVELPPKIDRILSLANGDGFRPPPSQRAVDPRGGSTVAVVASGLAMVAVVVIAEPLRALAEAAGVGAVWAERGLAVAFLSLGLVLLRAVRSGR